jgi:hypothetical protein
MRSVGGKENDVDDVSKPEQENAASKQGDRRRPEQPAAKKKQRASAPLPSAAAEAPDTEAKPLSERLAAHRKRSFHPDAGAAEQEGSPAKKLKADKPKSALAGRATTALFRTPSGTTQAGPGMHAGLEDAGT